MSWLSLARRSHVRSGARVPLLSNALVLTGCDPAGPWLAWLCVQLPDHFPLSAVSYHQPVLYILQSAPWTALLPLPLAIYLGLHPSWPIETIMKSGSRTLTR